MMQKLLRAGWIKMGVLVCMAAASACALSAELAGSVSFVIGDASVIGAEGKTLPVARNDAIHAGRTLVTGATGHIHLRMIDGAFVSVRPQSRLRIEEYHYDATAAANNRIKFVLEQGVARSITGRAGEAAKENYRLNTPLAAIGIRGTDFVVQAGADLTRVTVQSGAVAMSPFGGDCLASALGPCKSAATRVLTAAMRDAYLELRSRNEVPLLVPAEKALESPNLVAPPRPEEPRASDKQSKTSPADSQDAVREATAGTIKTTVDANANVNVNTPAPTPPVVVVPPPAAKFWWGRWSSFVQPGQATTSYLTDYLAEKTPDRVSAGGSDVFLLLREKGDVTLPNSGIAKFQLAESEAYVLTGGKTLTAARVTDPSLTVDFGARRFDTALTVNSNERAPVSVQASGNVSWQGQLLSDPNAATGTKVNGYLARDTSQAGYVFQRDLSGGLSVVGATRWIR